MNIRQALPLILGSAVLVLNLVDAMFTLVYTQAGLATEANPLMNQALQVSPVLFVAAKLALVSLGVLLLWRLRNRLVARLSLGGMLIAYAAIAFYHLQAAPMLVAIAQ